MFEKKKVAVMKHTMNNVVKTNKILDVLIEMKVLGEYKDWALSNLQTADNKENMDFFDQLWTDICEDLLEAVSWELDSDGTKMGHGRPLRLISTTGEASIRLHPLNLT